MIFRQLLINLMAKEDENLSGIEIKLHTEKIFHLT